MKSQNQLLVEAVQGNSMLAKIGLLHRYTIIDNPSSGTLQVVERALNPKSFEWMHSVIGSFQGLNTAMAAIRALVISGAIQT
jgi:hypothetical protein